MLDNKKTKWHQRYMELSNTISQWSEDPNKQVGAIIVRDNRVVSVGFNGLASGVHANHDRLNHKETKLEFFEHAERNAIYTAAKMGHIIDGSTMYCNWFPCNECARGIIQSGIKTLVTKEPDLNSSWHAKMMIAQAMFLEAGIEVIYL